MTDLFGKNPLCPVWGPRGGGRAAGQCCGGHNGHLPGAPVIPVYTNTQIQGNNLTSQKQNGKLFYVSKANSVEHMVST